MTGNEHIHSIYTLRIQGYVFSHYHLSLYTAHIFSFFWEIMSGFYNGEWYWSF